MGSLEGHRASLSRPLRFNSEEFSTATTYIFRIRGVITAIQDSRGGRSPEELQQEVVEKINALIAAGKRVIFLSNNSEDSRKELARQLVSMGIALSPEDAKDSVLTSSYTCAWFLRRAGASRPFVLCSDTGLLEELREFGITNYVATVDDDGNVKSEFLQASSPANVTSIIEQIGDIDAIVVGWDQQLTTLKINVAIALLQWTLGKSANGKPVQLISCAADVRGVLGVTQKDFCSNQEFGNLAIPGVGNGTMAHAICSGVEMDVKPKPIVVGAPSEIMLQTLQRPK